MRYLVYSLLFLVQFSFSQSVEFKKENFPNQKDAFKIAFDEYKIGLDEYEKGVDYYKYALNHLLKANDFNPNNAYVNFVIGDIIINTVHCEESLKYLENAYKLDPNIDQEILHDIAISHRLNENWDQSIAFFRKYESYTCLNLL